ncbi:MAG: inorganic diphosphatase [Pseudomonadota bacterium]
MSFKNIGPGKDVPNDINVIIEIPMNADPIKYEVDKETGAVTVDRFMATCMFYPVNYGFMPHTVAGDGDPVDVLVMAPYALAPGSVIRVRPVALLKMEDDGGVDAKVLAVPVTKLTPIYKDIQDLKDVPQLLQNQLTHFFERYKDLEPGKWVKVQGWFGVNEAKAEILAGVERAKA